MVCVPGRQAQTHRVGAANPLRWRKRR